MAIKYVENYRISDSATDSDTIQAAIDALEDGDTLIFERGRTYILDEPVNFTSYVKNTTAGITRNFLTIDGNGCTICGSDAYNTAHGKDSSNSLFFISDDSGNGMNRSTIENFVFRWTVTTDGFGSSRYPYESRNMAIAVKRFKDSDYFNNGVIKNCEFHQFGTGIYMCGESVIIELCYFDNCYTGINSDGTTQLDARMNYFYCPWYRGLVLNYPQRCSAYSNVFYKCQDTAIRIVGATGGITKELTANVYSNKIFGGEKKDPAGNITDTYDQIGIGCYGIKNAIIRDNFIQDICHKESDTAESYGIGIYLGGNNYNSDDFRSSSRVIVANNMITDSQRMGIKVALSSACTISGNSIHSGDRGAGADYGIYVTDNAGDLHISDNALYYFTEGKFVRPSKYNVNMIDNTCYGKNGKFDPLSPARYVRTYVSEDSPTVICIPELSVDLEENVEFNMLIPEGYSSSTITTITYNGLSGNVKHNGSIYLIPSSERGNYVKLKYTRAESYLSGEKYLVFTLVE